MLAAVLLLPTVVLFALFLLFPLFYLLSASVMQLSPVTRELHGFTLANYAILFDWYYAKLFLTTFRIGLSVTAICALLAYPIAYLLSRARPWLLKLGMFLLVLPLMTSAVIAAFGWLLMLGRRGLVNSALQTLGIEPVSFLNSEGAVVVALVQLMLPYMVLPLLGSIDRIPVALEEVVCNLGGSFWTMCRRLLLPLSFPGLLSGCVLVFSVSISSLIVPAMLGGRAARMVGNDIFEHLLVSFDLPTAACLAVALILLTMGLMASAALGTGGVRQRWAG